MSNTQNENILFPSYLFPLSALGSAQVTGKIKEKTTKDGVQKTVEWAGTSTSGWVVPVEFLRGTKTKQLPNGQVFPVLDVQRFNVTVFQASKPAVEIGDYVAFTDVAIGAIDGSLFIQAMGVQSVNDFFTLDGLDIETVGGYENE